MIVIVSTILVLIALFAVALAFIMLTELMVFMRSRVPFVPSPQKNITELVKKLPITKDDYVFDLGSGNGKVIFAIEQLSGARVKGFQFPGWTQVYAKLKGWLSGSRAELVSEDFFKHSWSDATVIYAYLYPFLMRDIGEKAKQDCRPGTRIVARDFFIPTLDLHERWDLGNGHEMFIYII